MLQNTAASLFRLRPAADAFFFLSRGMGRNTCTCMIFFFSEKLIRKRYSRINRRNIVYRAYRAREKEEAHETGVFVKC